MCCERPVRNAGGRAGPGRCVCAECRRNSNIGLAREERVGGAVGERGTTEPALLSEGGCGGERARVGGGGGGGGQGE
jgi:hypothetical protein